MAFTKAFILGAGPMGRMILEILRAQGCHESIEFVDDNADLWNREINGARIVGGLDCVCLRQDGRSALITALGNPKLRLAVAREARERSIPFLNAIHPSAVVSPSATLGVGTTIASLAAVGTDARIGDHVIISTGAIVEHDCRLEDGMYLCPGALVGGRVSVGEGSFLGVGAVVLPRISIGAWAVVGASALVTEDVPSRVVVMGSPARIIAKVNENYDWKRLL
jgi:UDP-perosamine 4-acetyltransferase